jgi:hypothetical protein
MREYRCQIKMAPAVLLNTPRPGPKGRDPMASAEFSAIAHTSTYRIEAVAAKAEAELERLRAARTALASRIDKAESILTRQLGNLNGFRPIRIAIHVGGGYSYRVLSDGKLGRSYNVDPQNWGCSCVDHVRREAACKHGIAAWVLEQAYTAPVPKVAQPEPASPPSLRNAVPLTVAIEGLERMSA